VRVEGIGVALLTVHIENHDKQCDRCLVIASTGCSALPAPLLKEKVNRHRLTTRGIISVLFCQNPPFARTSNHLLHTGLLISSRHQRDFWRYIQADTINNQSTRL